MIFSMALIGLDKKRTFTKQELKLLFNISLKECEGSESAEMYDEQREIIDVWRLELFIILNLFKT